MSSRPELRYRIFPFLQWWGRVNAGTLRADTLAGLVSAVVVIPQGVAFATLAGMPAEYGLYLAMVPAVVAALWGSSWHAVSGPTTAVSLLVFATLSPLATPASPEYITLALTLSFMSGTIMLVLGLARLGTTVNFISQTVVVGFTAGAGVLIAASQLRNFFGIDLPHGESLISLLWAFVTRGTEAKPLVVATSVFTLFVALAVRRWLRKLPYMIVALTAGTIAAYIITDVIGLTDSGLVTIGAVPSPLPPLSAPDLSPDTISRLLGIALSITLLSLAQAVPISQAIGVRAGQRIDANQEFIGQGLSNIAASFFSGYPSSASLNRSGANYEAGARTPLAAVLSAPFLVVIMFGIAPLIALIPLSAMAAILFIIGWGLIDFEAIRKISRLSRAETLVMTATFVATLVMSLEIAVLFGVFISLIAYLYRTSRPTMRSLVPDPRHSGRKVSEVAPGLPECPQLKILRIEGSIYFGAVNHVSQHFDTLRAISPDQKHLLIMAKSINFIDVAGADLLAHEARLRRAHGGQIYFYSLRQATRDMLTRSGQVDENGSNVFASKEEAIAGVLENLDRDICRRCDKKIFRECGRLSQPAGQGHIPS